jgi:hypothetical protein
MASYYIPDTDILIKAFDLLYIYLFLLHCSQENKTLTIHSIPIVDFANFKTNPKKVAQGIFNA